MLRMYQEKRQKKREKKTKKATKSGRKKNEKDEKKPNTFENFGFLEVSCPAITTIEVSASSCGGYTGWYALTSSSKKSHFRLE
jgi:hypothetical protein